MVGEMNGEWTYICNVMPIRCWIKSLERRLRLTFSCYSPRHLLFTDAVVDNCRLYMLYMYIHRGLWREENDEVSRERGTADIHFCNNIIIYIELMTETVDGWWA